MFGGLLLRGAHKLLALRGAHKLLALRGALRRNPSLITLLRGSFSSLLRGPAAFHTSLLAWGFTLWGFVMFGGSSATFTLSRGSTSLLIRGASTRGAMRLQQGRNYHEASEAIASSLKSKNLDEQS